MPFLSKPSHSKLYVQPANFESSLKDIKQVITTITHLDINPSLKYRMLVHTIWEITELRGSFNGRYRSRGMLVPGVPIQRDHVRQKGQLVKRLMVQPDELDIILADVVHCVVTKAEHDRLTEYSRTNKDIDGWDRYRNVGVEVIDMLTGKPLE